MIEACAEKIRKLEQSRVVACAVDPGLAGQVLKRRFEFPALCEEWWTEAQP